MIKKNNTYIKTFKPFVRNKKKLEQYEEYNILSNETKEALRVLPARVLMLTNEKLREYVYRDITLKAEIKKNKNEVKINLGFALCHSLVFPSVIEEIKKNKKLNIFKGLNYYTIHVFLSCYVISTKFKGVIQQKQILKFQANEMHDLRTIIEDLVNIGFIEQLNTQQVYSKTGLISASNNRGTYARKNYRISLKGHAEIDRFIKIYSSLHEKMTENTFLHDFLTLK
jgi:hypothetical protein